MGSKLDLLNLMTFSLESLKTESKDMLKWLNKLDRKSINIVSGCDI